MIAGICKVAGGSVFAEIGSCPHALMMIKYYSSHLLIHSARVDDYFPTRECWYLHFVQLFIPVVMGPQHNVFLSEGMVDFLSKWVSHQNVNFVMESG